MELPGFCYEKERGFWRMKRMGRVCEMGAVLGIVRAFLKESVYMFW